MIGALIGDIVGSRYEFDNHRSKDFELFDENCFFTDDSVMTLAVANALIQAEKQNRPVGECAVEQMQKIGRNYPDCGYGGSFFHWIYGEPVPYNSFGNGAAMRVSPCAYAAKSLQEALELSDQVTEVSHNHPEGLKGARAVTAAIFLAKKGADKKQIRDHIEQNYYPLDFTLDEIRDTYQFNETCQQTVPQAIEAFLESESFEDAIRNAISVGGDSDTLAAITGSIAQAFYGVDAELEKQALGYLDERLLNIYQQAKKQFGTC